MRPTRLAAADLRLRFTLNGRVTALTGMQWTLTSRISMRGRLIQSGITAARLLTETADMLRTHAALRDLATLAGNATDAALHASIVARITSAFPSLRVTEEGHPAAFREEGGHQRLRPDAWLYSIFLPIEASLLSPAQAAQALFYAEWGLERDAILPCDDGSTNCGEVVWVSRTCLRVETFALALCCLVAIRPPTGYLPCGACASYGPGAIMPWHRRTSLQGCLTMALLFWKETCGEICC